MSWTRRAVIAAMALAVPLCLGFAGCGDDEDYACDTACLDLADRWDDCTLDFGVLPDSSGSESSVRDNCISKLGTANEIASEESAKLAVCEKLSSTIRGVYCSDLQQRVSSASPTTWLDVMRAVYE